MTKKLNVENPKERESFMGPVINLNAYNNFKRYSKLASQDGNILTGGSVKQNGELEHGFYVEPTIVDGLPINHPLLKKELFVPILCICEYDNFDNAIKMTNESEYGLTSGIYSNKKEEISKFLQFIEAGVVYVNRKKSSTTWSGSTSPTWADLKPICLERAIISTSHYSPRIQKTDLTARLRFLTCPWDRTARRVIWYPENIWNRSRSAQRHTCYR